MTIRPLHENDVDAWIRMRVALWPFLTADEHRREGLDALAATPPLVVFVSTDGDQLTGFIELSLRSYAEGCETSPVPYVEGWYVEPEWRRGGVGTALMRAVIQWSREHGYRELGSDTEIGNALSRTAHKRIGFDEVEELVVFRMVL